MLVIQVTRNRPRFSRLFLSCNLRHDLLSPNYGAKMQNVKDYKEELEDESSGSGKVQKSFLAPSFSRSDVNFPQISIFAPGPTLAGIRKPSVTNELWATTTFLFWRTISFWILGDLPRYWMDGHLKAVDKLWVGGAGLSSRLGWIRRFVLGDLGIKPHLSFQAVKVWLP